MKEQVEALYKTYIDLLRQQAAAHAKAAEAEMNVKTALDRNEFLEASDRFREACLEHLRITGEAAVAEQDYKHAITMYSIEDHGKIAEAIKGVLKS